MSSEFVWIPSEEFVRNSNLRKFMDTYDVQTFEELRARSVSDVEWFWDSVSKFLEIKWQVPYYNVLDISNGIQWPKWFLGGKLNIAENCLDKQQSLLSEKTALISVREDGRTRTLSYRELLNL